MLKTVYGTVEGAVLGNPLSLTKVAKSGSLRNFEFEERPGYLYVAVRAASSRVNKNYDAFTADELKTAYKTFEGRPVYVNHHNTDKRRARGVIMQAKLHEDAKESWVEPLLEMDMETYPNLCAAILAGDIDTVSMGCNIQFSTCSVCGNKARFATEYCFPAGELVSMADGTHRPIEQVEVGDRVLTHDGVGVVSDTMERDYDGKLAVISRKGYAKPLRVTFGHEVLANMSGGRDERTHSYESVHDEGRWGWVPSEEIKSGFWVKVAFPTEVKVVEIETESLASDFAQRDGRTRLAKGSSKWGLPVTVDNTNIDLAYIMGLFVAEGSFENQATKGSGTPTTISWSLGSHEGLIIDELQSRLDSIGAGELKVYKRDGQGGVSVRLSNAPLAALLMSVCGVGAKTKSLSEFIMLAPRDFQVAFMAGYLDGDGYEDDRGGTSVAVTASEMLARQLVSIGSRIHPSVPTWWEHSENIGGPTNRDARFTIHRLGFRQSGVMRNRRRLDDGYVAAQVMGVAEDDFDGKVYNIEVEGQHSYVVEGVVVHNCTHIQRKGNTFPVVQDDGSTQMVLAFEYCYGVDFFEISWVFDPADTSAVVQDIMKEDRTAMVKVAAQEIRAPEPVDTLHSVGACPQCGNDNWDGMVCDVCGYANEPESLSAPDTDLAKEQDLPVERLEPEMVAEPEMVESEFGDASPWNLDEREQEGAEAPAWNLDERESNPQVEPEPEAESDPQVEDGSEAEDEDEDEDEKEDEFDFSKKGGNSMSGRNVASRTQARQRIQDDLRRRWAQTGEEPEAAPASTSVDTSADERIDVTGDGGVMPADAADTTTIVEAPGAEITDVEADGTTEVSGDETVPVAEVNEVALPVATDPGDAAKTVANPTVLPEESTGGSGEEAVDTGQMQPLDSVTGRKRVSAKTILFTGLRLAETRQKVGLEPKTANLSVLANRFASTYTVGEMQAMTKVLEEVGRKSASPRPQEMLVPRRADNRRTAGIARTRTASKTPDEALFG